MFIACGFTIVDNHFSHKKKTVSFCDEVKEYDGCSDFNRNFARLCHLFFNPKNPKCKITHSFDMINFIDIVKDDIKSTPRSFIEKCLEESQITKAKLLDLKRQEKILQMANELYNSKAFIKMTEGDGGDEYWNNEFWRIRSSKISNGDKKIAILRNGCRDFNLCLSVCHLPLLDSFIKILNETLEWY
jgi:hypothetical protein